MIGPRLFIATALTFGLPACSSDSGDDDGGDGPDDGYELLIDHDWSIPPGEHYYCIRQTLEEDLYIGGFEAIAPMGTHHTLISAGNPVSPDGVFDCSAGEHNFTAMIYESSTGTDRFELPDGLAAKVPAGAQINLNLHVINAGDGDLSGTSGVRYLPRAEAEVTSLATIVHMGPVTLELPEGETTTVVGQCTLPANVTAFGVMPHMHALATHQKVTVKNPSGDVVLFDDDFSFDATKHLFDVEPMVEINQGTIVEVACTYNNTTGAPVYWGNDSYSAEMCSGAVYLFPAEGVQTICAN